MKSFHLNVLTYFYFNFYFSDGLTLDTRKERHNLSKVGIPDAGCHNCGKIGQLHQCTNCRQVKYCDRNCQKQDWKDHKKNCQKKD